MAEKKKKIGDLTEEEWKTKLSPEEYRILRQKGTEAAWSGNLTNSDKSGIYSCAGCGETLFDSNSKYESHSGWPSFYDVAKQGKIKESRDTSHGMTRIEISCATCGGHLGHKFEDGPAPTGSRYCVNSISLKFHEQNK